MRECVGDTFAECPFWLVRHADANHPDLNLFLPVVCPKAGIQLFHDAKQRPPKQVIDFYVDVRKRQKRDLEYR